MKKILSSYSIMAWIIITASILLKTFYIFKCTLYASSVHFDMAAYWNSALERVSGNVHGINQYAIFPPAYIYILSSFLNIIKSLGLMPHALEIDIFINILLSSISGYVVYSLTYRLVIRKFLALLALFCYCFSYTTIYLNALTLPENLAIPLLVIAIGIVSSKNLDWRHLILSGTLLGIALSAKPLLTFLVFAFVFHIAYSAIKEKQYWKITLFLAFCLLAPVCVIYKNYDLSDGKLLGFGAYGGANFYASWAHVREIDCHTATQGNWWVSFPSTFDDPNSKSVTTIQPFYNQGYYYQLGLQTIAHDPAVLLKKLLWTDKLFFGGLSPTLSSQPWLYNFFMQINQWTLYIAFLSIGIPYLFFLEYSNKRILYFLYSLLGLFFLGIYLIGTFDRRYISFVESLILIIFFVSIDKVCVHRNNRIKIILYSTLVVTIFVIAPIVHKNCFNHPALNSTMG